ncbi:MAG TPA: hypothetical protein VIT67_15810 [Povalibacter sp.]
MEGPACSEGRMIIHAAALIATGTAAFVLGGAAGASAGVGAYAVILIAWCLLKINAQDLAQVLPEPVEPPQFSAYDDIEDDIGRLEEIGRERNWDLAKRLAIAHMAHEDPIMTIDDLERRYDDAAKCRA